MSLDIRNLIVIDPVVIGLVDDARIDALEQVVCEHYNVNHGDLSNWVRDTEAKKMICFLLHQYCNYSIASLSDRYNINYGYLSKCVRELYLKCLADGRFKSEVDSLVLN